MATVNENPNGTFSLVGDVPAALAFVNKEGNVPTDAEIRGAKHCGPGFVGLRPRSWATHSEALEAITTWDAGLGVVPPKGEN